MCVVIFYARDHSDNNDSDAYDVPDDDDDVDCNDDNGWVALYLVYTTSFDVNNNTNSTLGLNK